MTPPGNGSGGRSNGNGARNPRNGRPSAGHPAARTESPRRVRHGFRLKSREEPRGENWVAVRWLKLLESAIDPEQRKEGLTYARSGQTISLNVTPGAAVIEASVQGRAPRPYTTHLKLPALTDAQWHELILAMAGEAMYAAKLLAHDIPAALDDLFAAMGLELLPARPDYVAITCTCDVAGPCKHAAAVGYLLAERISNEPSLIFDLYGMSAERVLERLRQARAMQTHGAASASGLFSDAMIPESQIEPPPLEACLDDFWRCGPHLAELEQAPPPQHVAHALLRRLGPSPMNGRFPMAGLLASVYDCVSAAAVRIRDQAEQIAEPRS